MASPKDPFSRSAPMSKDGASAPLPLPAAARILQVDADDARAHKMREAIEIAGFPEPERACSGDEALDLLGARAQRFDIVAVWAPLPDASVLDLAGVLRRIKSPVRLAIVTDLSPRDFPRPGRLAGACAVEGRGGERGVIRCLRAIQNTGPTVAAVVADGRVPRTLDPVWARAIYGAPPGSRLTAPLD